MSHPTLLLGVLVLLGIANSAPMFLKNILKSRLSAPIDGGLLLRDGRPLFGSAKTIRGVLASLVCTALAASPLGFDWTIGAQIAAAAMAGDLGSSFLKRRLGLPPHAQAFGLDQIPESLLPLLLLRSRLQLDATDIAAVVAAFLVLEILLSRLLFKLRLRDRPY